MGPISLVRAFCSDFRTNSLGKWQEFIAVLAPLAELPHDLSRKWSRNLEFRAHQAD